MGSFRSVSPHVVLVRNFAKGSKNTDEFKNYLFALQIAIVPTVNGIESLLAFLERGNAIHAGLLVESKLPEDFQMVPIDFFANVRELNFGDKVNFPIVAKGSSLENFVVCLFWLRIKQLAAVIVDSAR